MTMYTSPCSVYSNSMALAVLDKMDKQSISLDSIVSIKASQMLPNTYSPLRKKFPDQDFTITLRELSAIQHFPKATTMPATS